MRSKPELDDEADEIPITPLIDAVFLLLIFFLVSTMIKKINRDIDIELPESVSAERLSPASDNRVIGLNARGEVFYEGQETTIQSLHKSIRSLGLQEQAVQIRLDVDRDTPTHRVIEVLDLCRFNNLFQVGIRTYDEFYNRP
jgi:biopolymer transport protein ExbD